MEKSKTVVWLEKHLPTVFLVIIRIVEMFSSSIIPSIISVMVVFMRPSDGAWDVMIIFAFILATAANWYFWMDYVAERESVKEFYIVNGSILGLYIAVSIVGYYIFGDLAYSLSYANLRILEPFSEDIKTFVSVIITDVFMVAFMIVCERYSRRHIEKIKEILKKNGADKVEMADEGANVVPTKENREVELLTAEQMEEQVIRDESEYAEVQRKAAESAPEKMWNEDFTKGKGESFKRVDFSMIDEDIDENDYIQSVEAENKNKDYDSDSLWNKEIYRGRTEGDKPITDFSYEENEMPPQIEDTEDDEPLWSEDMYRGMDRSKKNFEEYESEEEEYRKAAMEKLPYESDSLWEKKFYKGRNESNIPEQVMDLSDEVTMVQDEHNAAYSPDNLWDNISSRAADDAVDDNEAETANPNKDYDSESLWSSNIYQGRKKNDE